MMTGKMTRAIFTIASVVVVTFIATHANGTPVGVILPYFEGQGWIARNVPTVLNLQIWQTLRRAPHPNPHSLDFGDGIVMWAEYPLEKQSYHHAEELAKDADLQMTLWGAASPYGDGVVVQTFLSIPKYEDGRMVKHEIWTVPLRLKSRELVVKSDIPTRHYEFAPIILKQTLIGRFSSPGALKMYREKELKREIGTVGDSFEAVRNEGDKVQVKASGMNGWVHLPALSAERNEVTDFTGGLIRLYRGDWGGSLELMSRVSSYKGTPTSVRVDAYLFQALAKVRLGRSPSQELAKARQLSPQSAAVVRYEVMNDLEVIKKRLSASPKGSAEVRRVAAKVRRVVAENRYLFPSADVWLRDVDMVVAQILDR